MFHTKSTARVKKCVCATQTNLIRRHDKGVLYSVAAPDTVPFSLVHVFGSPRERGEAHGFLLSAHLIEFIEKQMPAFFREYVDEIDLSGLPGWLQGAIRKLLPIAAKAAPTIFELALTWLEHEQFKFNNASRSRVYEEMAGIAHGACAAAAETGVPCDEAWRLELRTQRSAALRQRGGVGAR